jgi:hypothetical protein
MSKPQRKSGVLLEEIAGEFVFFDPASSQISYGNATAALVWRLCDGTRTPEDIAALLSDAYPDSSGTVNWDVAEILAFFRDHQAFEPE